MRRLIRVMVALLLLGGVAVLVGPSAATATSSGILPECKEPPLPAKPELALSVRPSSTSTGDPFANPDITINSVYGSGYNWFSYDNGCSPTSSIMPDLGSGVGSFIGLEIPQQFISMSRALNLAVADPSGWIGALDQPVEQATKAIGAGFWRPWLPVALLLVAAMILWAAKGGNIAKGVTATVWALLVLVLVSWTLNYPVEAVDLVDSASQTAITGIATGFSGVDSQQDAQDAVEDHKLPDDGTAGSIAAVKALEKQWDQVDRSTSYRTWLTGVFGDPDSTTAKKYGPTIFKATHFSWSEWDQYKADPEGKGKEIVDAKGEAFTKAAEKVQKADPLAYDYLTGNRWFARVGTAVIGWAAAFATVVFLFFSSIGMLLGFLAIRLAVPVSPAAGVLFMFEGFRDMAMGLLRRIGALLVAGPIFMIAALVVLRMNSALIGVSAIPVPFRLLFIAAISWIAWKLVRPSAVTGTSSQLRRILGTAAGIRLGSRKPPEPEQDTHDSSEDDEPSQRPDGRYRKTFPGRDKPVAQPLELEPRRTPLALPASVPAPGTQAEDLPYYAATPHTPGTFIPREAPPAPLTARQAREQSALPPAPVQRRPIPPEAPGAEDAAATAAGTDQHLYPAALGTGPIREGDGASLIGVSGHSGDVPEARRDSTGLASGGGMPIEGRVSESLPYDVNEANVTYDEDGRQVFEIYNPNGNRRVYVEPDE